MELTAAEFDVLALLLRSAGNPVTRQELSFALHGRQFDSQDRSIDMHISNLRHKLGSSPDGIERVRSVRGVGYFYACCEEGIRKTPQDGHRHYKTPRPKTH